MKKMKTIRQILAFLVSAVILCTASVALTAAFLTDRDSEANVFTVGDVSIELNEDFAQNSALIPGVKIEKKPSVTNTGKNDAWVWVDIAIPAALDDPDASKNVVHFNYDKESVEAGKWNWKKNNSWNTRSEQIGGIGYTVYTVLYETALEPGMTTDAVMTRVYMDTHMDIDPDGSWWWIEGGVAYGKGGIARDEGGEAYWNSKTAPIMYVSAYGIQKEKFDDVTAAYEAYNKQWGDKGTEWDEVDGLPGDTSPIQMLITAGFTDIEWDESLGGWSVVYTAVVRDENGDPVKPKQDTTPQIPGWNITDGTHTGPVVRVAAKEGTDPAWENVTSVTFPSGTFYIDEDALPKNITLYVKADTKLNGHSDPSWTTKTYTGEDGSDPDDGGHPDDGEYTTVNNEADLIAALQAGGKVRLGGDITTAATPKVPKGVTVTLDLNGHTLTHQDINRYYTLMSTGALTIIDSDSAGNGKIDGYVLSGSYDENDVPIPIEGCSLTIKGGTFTKQFLSYNATNVSGGTFESSAFFMSDVDISGGSFAWAAPRSNTPISAVISGGSFETFRAQAPGVSITDGSFDLLSIEDDNISISGGQFTEVWAYNTATITGGTFDVFAICNNNGINISGGSFGALHNTVDTNAGYDIESVVNITGGTFGKFHNYYVSKDHGGGDIRNGWGVANISGGSFGEFINDEGAEDEGAKAVISGGTFDTKPNDSWLETGYKTTENSDSTWTVTADEGGTGTDDDTDAGYSYSIGDTGLVLCSGEALPKAPTMK